MKITRRGFVLSAFGAAAAAAVGTAAIAAPPPRPSPGGGRGGGVYQPNGLPGVHGDMAMQMRDGRWSSHLLPFAAFPTQASLAAELTRGRQRGLFK